MLTMLYVHCNNNNKMNAVYTNKYLQFSIIIIIIIYLCYLTHYLLYPLVGRR